MAFRKLARVELLATYRSLDTGWKKVAKAACLSKFANSDYRSIQEILNAVADKYVISKDPADYVFAVYRAVTQDVPNGNGDAFPREELLSFNKWEKKPVYMTFEFKPHFVNHQSDDPRLSRGVVVDAHFNESDPGDCFVELLVAIDSKKDPILAQGVIDNILNTVSMGCDSLRTECNVCNNVAFSPADYCIHIKSNKLKMCKAPDGEMKLAFERCYEVTFQEISNVDDPADKKAEQQEVLTVAGLPTDRVASQVDVVGLRERIRKVNEANYPSAVARAASVGEGMSVQVTAKAAAALPEHHRIASIYSKHYEVTFGHQVEAMEKTMSETGKSEDEIRRAWDQKMAESIPDARVANICGLLNAHVATCGDMKKAIKRTAKDMDIDPAIVGKCADYMRECNRMAKSAATKVAQDNKHEEPGKAAIAEGAPAEPAKKESAEAPAIETNLPGSKDAPALGSGEPQDVSKKIAEAATSVAQRVATEEDKEKAEKEAAAVKQAADDKEKADAAAKQAADDKAKDEAAKAAQAVAPSEAPVAPAAAAAGNGEVEQAQTDDAPNKKSLGDMGVKTANQFPFAKFYADVTARKTASGDVHVSRDGKHIFTVSATQKVSAQDVLKQVASVGFIGAMKKLSAIAKTADAGVGEGATSDAKGAYGPAPGSAQEGAVSDMKDSRGINPASTTAEGNNSDMKDKVDTKSIGNSDVREGVTTDTKGGRSTSDNSMVQVEHSDRKEDHGSKNVGSDNILSERQVDMVLKGLDPRSASLVRDNLAKLAQAMKEDLDKKAQEDKEKAEKEASAKKAQEDKEKAEKKASDDKASEKAVEEKAEKKAKALNDAFTARFKRGMKLMARRFALNLEPCHLKFNIGEVLSTRHEASGFAGLDQDLVIDVVERGFNQNAAMVKTAEHMIKRASELCAMPEDALAAIEADAENMNPAMPGGSEHKAGEESMEKQSDLRRRASVGSMPVIRSSSTTQEVLPPGKAEMVRGAIAGGILSRRLGR